jgi:hypothetical protein
MEYEIDFVILQLPFFYFVSLNGNIWRRYADLHPSQAGTLALCTYKGDEPELYGNYLINSIVMNYL